MQIAIIGAGLAGLACARGLTAAGATVRVFDKGRSPGGRLATRRVALAGRRLQFDHGAQYLTVRGPDFAAALAGAPIAAWPDPECRVGTPGMAAVARYLAADLNLSCGAEILRLSGQPGAWTLHTAEAEHGPFDSVVAAIPPAQALQLLAAAVPSLPARLGRVRVAPCWTAMAAFAAPLPLPDTLRPQPGSASHTAAGARAEPIGWAARDSSKPGRDRSQECWVVQATPARSRARLEETPDLAAGALLAALAAFAGEALPPVLHVSGHRWRFAAVEDPLGEPCLWDAARRIGLAGDWCIGPRAELAFDSGLALAAAMRT